MFNHRVRDADISCGPRFASVLGALLLTALCTAASADDGKKSWSVQTKIGVEHDDGVSIDELDNRSGQADRALTVDVTAAYEFFRDSASPVEISYDFSKISYDELSAFDLQSHSAFLSTGRSFGSIDTSFLYGVSHTTLAGDGFLNLHTVTPGLGYALTDTWYVSAAYNYQNKTFLTAAERDSHLHAGSIDNFIFFNEARSYFKFGYRFESENTSSSEYDYLGHYFNSAFKTKFGDGLGVPTITLSYQYYLKDYLNETASISREREDQRHTIKAEFLLPVHKHADLQFVYKYIKGHSNLSSSDFDENVINLSLKLSL